MSLPGISSYSGRYAYFALVVCLTLMAVAYLGWDYVNRTSRQQISQIEARSTTEGVLTDALTHLNLLENSLQRIIIEPNIQDVAMVELRLKRLGFTLQHLEQVLEGNKSNQAIAKELRKDEQQLVDASQDLVAIRTEVVRWFPALRLMREEMFPHHQQLVSLLDGLLIEIGEELSPHDQLQVFKTAMGLRSAWVSMISEMRLYVANRFGIFASEFREGMESRLTNITYYGEEIPGYLDALRKMSNSGKLGFVSESSLDEMDRHYQAWMHAFNQLSRIIENPNWRMDLLLMEEAVKPILDRMRQRLSSLYIDLNTQSARDITQLTNIARQLSQSILGISVAVILLIFFAYLFLFRNLLRPIAETALALKQEARGMLDIQPPPAKLKETRDLVDAFTEMRKQVHSRQRCLDHMAHHDALTQLPNRVLFRDRLSHALDVANRGNYLVGLLFLDLDRFKQINDSLGHLVGDELLKIVAERLQSLVRSSDTVARLSGDEFAILVERLDARQDVEPLAEKALAILEKPIQIAEHKLYISASIGIALAPVDDTSAEYLIRDADTAMYEAKRQGRATYRFFTGQLTHQATESLHLENALRQGVEEKQIFYHFQPIISLKNDGIQYCEALLRWRHPDRGMLLPEAFLDVLETTGLTASIMDKLLDQAEAHQRGISKMFGRQVAVAINLSVRLLNDPGFCRGLLERLALGQFQEGGLVLELTEDILTQELAEAEEFLQQVRSMGGLIALDDFGTGQASLSHLRQFPFDFLKIDREFIQNVDTDPVNANLVDAVIKLAHAFEMAVIAEGVEMSAQYDFVKALGCDYVQGYLTGAPEESCRLIKQLDVQ
ncbi:MAG: EAL domain-containing protein [Pseudomonadota bacterium]